MSLTSQEYAEIIAILDEYRQQHPERYIFISQWLCELNTMRLQVEKENLHGVYWIKNEGRTEHEYGEENKQWNLKKMS